MFLFLSFAFRSNDSIDSSNNNGGTCNGVCSVIPSVLSQSFGDNNESGTSTGNNGSVTSSDGSVLLEVRFHDEDFDNSFHLLSFDDNESCVGGNDNKSGIDVEPSLTAATSAHVCKKNEWKFRLSSWNGMLLTLPYLPGVSTMTSLSLDFYTLELLVDLLPSSSTLRLFFYNGDYLMMTVIRPITYYQQLVCSRAKNTKPSG